MPGFPDELKILLEHMIISHHGQYEFGSPKLPMFPEALMLHYLDDLDSKMEAMRAQFEREADLDSAWTSYNPSLARPLLNTQKFLDKSSAKSKKEEASSLRRLQRMTLPSRPRRMTRSRLTPRQARRNLSLHPLLQARRRQLRRWMLCSASSSPTESRRSQIRRIEQLVLDFSNFDWISFDCYGTLIDWETGILGYLQPLLLRKGRTLTDEQVLALYSEFEPHEQRGEYRSYREVLASVVHDFARDLNFEATEAEMIGLPDTIRTWQPFGDTVPALRRLQRQLRSGNPLQH